MHIEHRDVLSLTARAVAAWVGDHVDLLAGLAALRSLGAEADRAVDEVLAVRELRKVSLSVDLFRLLAAGTDQDAGRLLLEAGPPAQVRLLATALALDLLRPSVF